MTKLLTTMQCVDIFAQIHTVKNDHFAQRKPTIALNHKLEVWFK